ncbi:MAG: hypothetical protein MRY21_01865 [Simkaniaceae bacterium]|nr:hypothetical protein [Simkaniaceae bacterium]
MKKILFLIAVICAGCQTQNGWELTTIKEFETLTFESDRLGVEIQNDTTPRVYLVVKSGSIKAYAENYSRVRLEMGGKVYDFLAKRLKGDQKLLLPEGLFEQICKNHAQEAEATLRLYGYKMQFSIEEFIEEYSKLKGTL